MTSAVVPAAQAHLMGLCEQEGHITPQMVVDDAVDPASPLHDMFEWDDTAAADRYRLVQAGFLIRRYRVEVEVSPDRVVRARAFASVPADGGRGYVSTVAALADPERRDFVLEQAMREMAAFRLKYEGLIDVDEVLRGIVERG